MCAWGSSLDVRAVGARPHPKKAESENDVRLALQRAAWLGSGLGPRKTAALLLVHFPTLEINFVL